MSSDTHNNLRVVLAVVPEYDAEGCITHLDVCLLNRLDTGMDYEFDLHMNDRLVEGYTGHIAPNDEVYVADIMFAELNENPELDVYFNFPLEGKLTEVSKNIRLRPKNLHKSLKYSELMEAPALEYELYRPAVTKVHRNIEPVRKSDIDVAMLKHFMIEGTSMTEKHSVSLGEHEVDLHFEVLVKDESGYNAAEKLELQLETFHRKLDAAIAAGQHSMVVIHGVGSGRLKKEVHHILSKHPQVRSFQPSFEAKYGFGATEVFFR